MLLTLLFLVLFLLGIFMFIPIFKTDNWWKNHQSLSDKSDGYLTLGCVFGTIGCLGWMVCLILILIIQIPKNISYEAKLYERGVLEYRLEHKEENIIGNELLYNDIVEFNQSLRFDKRFNDSLWLNWFINEKIASIEYIDIGGNND